MTIKQQGGVFGRNPAFNNVDVTGSLTVDTTSKPTVIDRGSDFGDILQLKKDGTSIAAFASVFGNRFTFGSGDVGFRMAADLDSIVPWNMTGATTRNNAINLGESGNAFKDLYLSGNVIVSTGKGIDFSATSGAGTSELFDDYEEGTWTPVITANVTPATVSYTAQVGRYSKVGDVVTCGLFMNCNITVGGVGSLQVSLPFVAAQIDVGSYQHFPVGFAHVGNAEPIAYIGVRYNEASATIYRDINAVTSSASVTGQRWFYVQFSYFV